MSAGVIWFLVGGAFFLSELFSPMFILSFFGIGAWSAGVASLFTNSMPVMLTVFCGMSIVTLVLLRTSLVKVFTGRARMAGKESDESVSMHTDKLCTVSVAIQPPHPGEVSLGGSYWRAVAELPVLEGTTVRVLGHVTGDELTLRVVPAEDSSQK